MKITIHGVDFIELDSCGLYTIGFTTINGDKSAIYIDCVCQITISKIKDQLIVTVD